MPAGSRRSVRVELVRGIAPQKDAPARERNCFFRSGQVRIGQGRAGLVLSGVLEWSSGVLVC